jgi:hypothetical protein
VHDTPQRRSAPGEDGQSVVNRLARVDDDRQGCIGGKRHLRREQLALDVASGEIVVIVESDFATATALCRPIAAWTTSRASLRRPAHLAAR